MEKDLARERRDSWTLYSPRDSSKLTFFSVTSHLVIAGTEEPVRSLRAKIASITSSSVVMVFGFLVDRKSVFFVLLPKIDIA
jgi:hypothetical protein